MYFPALAGARRHPTSPIAPAGGASTRRHTRPRKLRPSFDGLESRRLFSLTPVASDAPLPFTAIVKVYGTFPNGQSYSGSGVMVDSFHVLTAGHIVYEADDGGWAASITVIPELSGDSAPFGEASMTAERTFTTWEAFSQQYPDQTGPGALDIGMITLNRPIGDETGWMTYDYSSDLGAYAAGSVFDTAGYPADPASGYSGTQMTYASGPIAGLSADRSVIEYDPSQIATYPGQSGSPLWADSTGVVSGIVVGCGNVDYATRITAAIYEDLLIWRAADTPPPTTTPTAVPPGVTSIGPTWRTARGLTSIGVAFDAPLNPASASDPARYSVLSLGTERVGRREVTVHRALRIQSVTYDAGAHTVRIYLARPHEGPVEVVVGPGMVGADGAISTQSYWRIIRPVSGTGQAAAAGAGRQAGNQLTWSTHFVGVDGGRIRKGRAGTGRDGGGSGGDAPSHLEGSWHRRRNIPIDLGSSDALRFE